MQFGPAILSILLFAWPALAADPVIEVHRGVDKMLYGSCVPSLAVDNRSMQTIEYLEVDLLLTLADGAERRLELQSAYREGILFPIAPGATAFLQQHLDTSRALGVPCDQVKDRKVITIVCEAAGGSACASPVSVTP
ncbi:hypothetical protein SAMN02745126_03400 [Enhydrobacter aerosaccus]|uniref:Uncharacterized protein n=1 Tax=Enhydrobacter aerosaccus TaxID=225324 RepID=A0A1T4QRF7_9HYPH|nr:hypothetical protein [Enhydrobacter aerosaccus]SKA06342.1 hypothetical protein SAMN02745126_03400 [Enhydrobacter aerosaccus]